MSLERMLSSSFLVLSKYRSQILNHAQVLNQISFSGKTERLSPILRLQFELSQKLCTYIDSRVECHFLFSRCELLRMPILLYFS